MQKFLFSVCFIGRDGELYQTYVRATTADEARRDVAICESIDARMEVGVHEPRAYVSSVVKVA